MCYRPWRAQTQETGRPLPSPEGDLLLPCGKCHECLSARSSEWATRCKHEMASYTENCFLTLTYDNENLPKHLFQRKLKFKNFMKNLRRSTNGKDMRYIVSHEFGSKTKRLHHHVLLMGHDFPNQVFQQKSPKGHPLFTSESLSKLWKHGYHSIGTATPETAYYIASYALKSTSVEAMNESGEIQTFKDCFNSSNRPGIGLKYLEKNLTQLLDSKEKLPRYYVKKLKEWDERNGSNYYEIYENNQLENPPTQRSQAQLYARYVANLQKANQDTPFRAKPDDPMEKLYTEYLKRESIETLTIAKERI